MNQVFAKQLHETLAALKLFFKFSLLLGFDSKLIIEQND